MDKNSRNKLRDKLMADRLASPAKDLVEDFEKWKEDIAQHRQATREALGWAIHEEFKRAMETEK